MNSKLKRKCTKGSRKIETKICTQIKARKVLQGIDDIIGKNMTRQNK